MTYDAIIIGGGHNGLCTAAYLAKAGRKVLVLERRHLVGGAAVSEEIYPGFTYTVCSYVVSLLRPWIIRDLNLAKHGLHVLPLEAAFTPLPDGRSLCRWPDPHKTREEIAQFSVKDADRYPEFGKAMGQLARFAKLIIDKPAPDPATWSPRELMDLLGLSRKFRDLGDDMASLQFKLATMSSADFLDEWFESDVLKAPMSVSGIIGTMLGVRSPGTAYVLLHHYMGEIDGASRAWGFAKGGNGAVSNALAGAAVEHGAEIRVNAGVERVLLKGGKAVGVVLSGSGDEIRAKTVISTCEPRLTFLGMVGEENLPDPFVAQMKRYKLRGSSGKVNFALDRFPEFSARPGDGPHVRGDVAICPSIDYLETAYDEAKYGDFSQRPFLNLVIPSLLDPGMAPPGKHVMSAFVQYAPYHIKEGPSHWPERREAFGDAVTDTIAEYVPGFKEMILHRQVLTPWDLEQEFGLTEGNIFHGELSADQLLFNRPTAGWARYRTPVKNLWLAGSGAHPGGGVMAAPGALAAMQMLKERAV
ncbi:MAG: NAD(P)/FAD-dependent oxidoreductase [Proteobacteria bacterium]|nr:NAD(P)/FAD-dependent oxidoreductase [Pseudomonadota bacterium]